MEFSASEIAGIIQGVVSGNEGEKVTMVSKIEEAEKGSLTFLSNPKYIEFIYSTRASVAIVGEDFNPEKSLPETLTLVKVKDPYVAFATLLTAYDSVTKPKPSISSQSSISENAEIGKNVFIGAFVSIADGAKIGDGAMIYNNSSIGENATIGDNVIINSNCSVYRDSIIGNGCIIHSGAIIGADGFGFAPKADGFQKIVQIGNVILEENVEIGANTCIDRATLGSTIIRKNVKLDNFIQVAHGVEIGENTVIAAQTGIAGSTKIGKNCLIGGQVGIIGHIEIADGVKIAAQSGIGQSITEKDSIHQGSPALPNRDFKRSYLYFTKLPDIKS
ncbi:MAG: UDP-3-O-[3-hydroxymyristoyl] glucosamine N-acyltransferase, partial [Granulosicoccus sp.]